MPYTTEKSKIETRSQDTEELLTLEKLQKSLNIAELLDDRDLIDIGMQVVKGYEIDEDSRLEWKQTVDKAMGIAKQTMEQKTFPWVGASNIKYPLITSACTDYASRTLPEIIQSERIVKTSIVGMDRDDTKYRRAARVSQYMSYQLLVDSPDWEDGTDKLLQIYPILGTVFKKTYYHPIEQRVVSELCVPDRVCVNYNTQSLETARRITHILTLYSNDIIERQRSGIYLESVDPELFRPIDYSSAEDSDYAIEILEQHCYLDLDGDGYKEPYIVTVHKDTKTILRIVARFKEIKKKNGKVMRIIPDQYFTDFHFIRSPDGGFYSMGFGSLLLPLNTSINTLINQLIDAGTLNNTQGGFLGKGLRLKNGEIKVQMGKWQVLDTAAGTDIASNVFPFPVREPSQTLYSLLGLLINVGKDLSATNDAMQGKQNATNVASSTMNQLIEQGSKVFVAINKRLYRGLKKEYEKVYELNFKYLKQDEYMNALNDQEADVKVDFNPGDLDVHPVADPTVSSENQRLIRAGMVQSLRTADPRESDIMFLQALQMDQSMIDRLLPKKDPKAPPALPDQKMEAEVNYLKAQIAKLSADATLTMQQNQIQAALASKSNQEADSRISESVARSWKMMQDAQHNKDKATITATKMQSEQQLKVHDLQLKVHDQQLKAQDQNIKAATMAQDMAHKRDVDQADILIKAKEAQVKEKQVTDSKEENNEDI